MNMASVLQAITVRLRSFPRPRRLESKWTIRRIHRMIDCNSCWLVGKRVLFKYLSARYFSARIPRTANSKFRVTLSSPSHFIRGRNTIKIRGNCSTYAILLRRAVKNRIWQTIFFSPARCEHMFRRISGSISFIGLTLAIVFLDNGQLADFGSSVFLFEGVVPW